MAELADAEVTAELREECRAWARHLLGVEPAEEIVARYAAAIGRLFPAEPSPADARLLRFARRHRWAIGALDAASARRPDNALRQRLVLMTAILETTTTHAPVFLNDGSSRLRVGCALLGIGMSYAAKRAFGWLVLMLAGGR
jgi:hypothetical protein